MRINGRSCPVLNLSISAFERLVLATGVFSPALTASSSTGCNRLVSPRFVFFCAWEYNTVWHNRAPIITDLISIKFVPKFREASGRKFNLPSQALSCSGYTGIISAFIKKHPGNSGGNDKNVCSAKLIQTCLKIYRDKNARKGC